MTSKIGALAVVLPLAWLGGFTRLPAQTFRAQSDLVVLQVAVHDKHETPVPNLSQSDFTVAEDRAPQRIRFFVSEDRPVAVGLVVDNSMSMYNKRGEVIAAADAFGRSSNPQDAMFTVNFNERVSFGLPDDLPFTADLSMLHRALDSIVARGQTALFDGIAAGLDHLNESPLDQKVLVIVSDGADNRSGRTFDDVLGRAQRSNAVLYAVGIFDEVEGGDRKVLRRLADATGGSAFFPAKLAEIASVFDRIAMDIRHRYTIGYVSTNARRDGSYRRVSVVARDPGTHRPLKVRVREGYVAGRDTSPETTHQNFVLH